MGQPSPSIYCRSSLVLIISICYTTREGKWHVQCTKEDGLSDRDSKKEEEALYHSKKIAPFILPTASQLPISPVLLE